MGAPYAESAGIFLITTLFDLYIGAVLLRFLLQAVRADFYNPVSQFLVKITNPLLKPLRRIIPGLFGLDIAAIVLMLALTLLELSLVQLLAGMSANIVGLLVYALAKLLSSVLDIYFYSILIQAVLSWVNPGTHNPVVGLLHALNEPLLRPARNILPAMGGLDLSPLVVMIVLKLMTILLVAPLSDLARTML